MLKDPYIFDFLSLGQAAHERDLERGLLSHVKAFMLELGAGFALNRQSASSRGQRQGLLLGFAVLPLPSALLRGD